MVKGLALSDVVNVTVSLEPLPGGYLSFGTILIMGPSSVIDVNERIRQYSNIDEVEQDFPNDSPEYQAAQLFFAQSPQPAQAFIGRWAQTNASGVLHGAVRSSAQQPMANFTSIHNGVFSIMIDGAPQTAHGIDWSTALNLNGVASLIQAQLTGVTVTWNATYSRFDIASNTSGAASSVSYGMPATAFNNIVWSGLPSGGDYITINGSRITFESVTATGNQLLIGTGSLSSFLASLVAFINSSNDVGISKVNAWTVGDTVYLQSEIAGAMGNNYTLVYNSASITSIGGGNFSGGYGAAAGFVDFGALPSGGDTLSINGSTITFESSSATGNELLIGTSFSAFMANLASLINGSNDINLSKISASVTNDTLNLISIDPTVAGSGIALTKSSSAFTLSGANFVGGGTQTDVSTMLGLTQASGASAPVVGVVAETALAGVQACANASSVWYGLAVATDGVLYANPSIEDYLAIASYIQASQRTRIFAVTSMDPECMDPTSSLDLASQLQALNTFRSLIQYSSTNPYAAVSMFGRAFSVDFTGSNTTITLKFKQEPLVQYETLTETEWATLKAKNCNVYALYNNGTAFTQEGVMCNGYFMDEVHGFDWLANAVQTNVFNELLTMPKIPQTDAGMHQLVTAAVEACEQGVTNGLLAPGIWNGPTIGPINNGDTLTAGYYVFAPLMATQSETLRAQRQAPLMQILCKEAGAIHFANVQISIVP